MNTFIEQFLSSASAHGTKAALVYNNESVTYDELRKRSAGVASALRGKGLGKGDIIPISMDRCNEAVVAIIGALRAGAAYCFIEPSYPEARREFIMSDIKADFLVDYAWTAEHMNPPAERAPLLDIDQAKPEDLALVVYTSGSTGNPKGVLLSHRSVAMALTDSSFFLNTDIFLSIAPFSFVASVPAALKLVAVGATLHIASDAVRKDIGLLAAYAKQNGITAAFIPPQALPPFLAATGGLLRLIGVGSEKLAGVYSEHPVLVNGYGSSESCGSISAFTVDRLYADSTPIGRPTGGSKVYILDDDMNEVPQGETGELYLAGQIAEGYLNLPELTAEKFVMYNGERVFRSGDLGYLNSDGQYVYVQRKDWMVKVRGFRVEPGEVEAAMARYAPIKKAVVKGFENMYGQTSLFGVYTAEEKIPPKAVLDAIRAFLPDYMLPAFLEQIDELPLNANGKVDRARILPPDAEKWKTLYEPPEGERERAVCEAFEKTLGLENIGALDDFGLLGGDSINALKLQRELAAFGITVSDILTLRTPRKLAAVLKENARPLEKAARRTSYPLTFAERQMAIEQTLHPDSVAYNVNFALKYTGRFDKTRFAAALEQLSARFPILRSYYVYEDGEYQHKIAEGAALPFNEIPCAREEEIYAQIKALNTPFEIGKPSLARVNLFRQSEFTGAIHFCMHHIIIDATGAGTLINALTRLYDGELLPPVQFDYTDYAVWAEARQEYADSEAFFNNMFAGGVPENDMPCAAARPAALPFASERASRTLDAAAVELTAKKLGVTPYTLLTAAIGITLGKYCASEDVVIGAAMNGRTLPETDDMVGMFVNTLPLRLKPSFDKTVADYVSEVSNLQNELQKHQTYPFERLVSKFAEERNSSRSPIFDVTVNYLRELPPRRMKTLSVSRLSVKGQELAMDLVFEFTRSEDSIKLELCYSDKLYDGAVVEGMLEQFTEVIKNITERGGTARVQEAARLPERQRKQILEDFTGDKSDENIDRTLVDLIRARARSAPDAAAVVFKDRVLSYAALDDLTDRLAARLAQKGIGKGGVAGILINRSEMMVVCALGVMKSGAAYLPLDPTYPAERLSFMVSDANAAVIIKDEAIALELTGGSGEYLYTGDIAALPPADALPDPPAPGDLMILLYTSGTTGTPKGVMLSQKNVVNYCTWYRNYFKLTQADNAAAYASFGFDASMMDVYPALISGGAAHIIPEETRLDLAGINDYYNRNKITVAFLTTQMGRAFAENMDNRSLRALSVGGETLTPIAPPKGYGLCNLYGPTECTVASSFFKVEGLNDRVPVGRALPNMELYVLDKQGELAPVGAAGELCIAGRQVSPGYLNRPELTAEKFVPNPFRTSEETAVMYKTGDVARFLPDGVLDFVGRRDFQIKIRGFRVELTEIEGRILQYPDITAASVVAQDAPGGGKRAVAYIVSRKDVDIKALNQFIEQKLPPYMVPATTTQIDKIPLTPNGKVDKRKLPKIEVAAEESVPPQTEAQKQLLDIARDILGVTELGITNDLMYMGLTSLSSIKFAARITKQTGKTIAATDIMREKTIEKLAALVERNDDYALTAFDKREVYPLTQNQLGVYFACARQPASVVYNIPFALELDAETSLDDLKKAALAVIAAHTYIKTRLVMKDGEVCQERRDEYPVEIPCGSVAEAEYEKLRDAFARPFNLFEGPLFRVELYRTEKAVHLLMDFHHIIFDGASADIFLRDLSKALAGEALEAETFTSFDLSLAEPREGDAEYDGAKAYFVSLLSDGEGATAIPADHAAAEDAGEEGAFGRSFGRQKTPSKEGAFGRGFGRQKTPSKEGAFGRGFSRQKTPSEPASVSAFIPEDKLSGALKQLAVTPASLFLGAVSYTASRFANVRQARLATIINGRDKAHLQSNLGMLVKTLPLVIDIPPASSARRYLADVQRVMLETMEHSAYPYTRIAADYSYEPQIMFAYQGGVIQNSGLAAKAEAVRLDAAKFPVDISVGEASGGYTLTVRYDKSLFKDSTMRTFADCAAHVAERFAANLDKQLGGFVVATEKQLERVASFCGPEQPLPAPALHELFERHAASAPSAVALIAADGEFTYEQLNDGANRVANALLELGVKPEDRIAFFLPRDSRVLFSILGILKAGGAYIPIDPAYPKERIDHIIADSGAKYILTDAKNKDAFGNGLDADKLLAHANAARPSVAVAPGNLCYVIYTSGSTGKPKGVMIEHKSAVGWAAPFERNIQQAAAVRHRCRAAVITTVSFDVFTGNVIMTLFNGLSLALADEEQARNPAALAELMFRTGANFLWATPSVLTQYMEHPDMKKALGGCKMLMVGGEKFPSGLYGKLRELTDAEIFNSYGPTETTIDCNVKLLAGPPTQCLRLRVENRAAMYAPPKSPLLDSGVVTVGAPVDGVAEQVMDIDGNPLPAGVVGELWIGGRGVGRGYLNKPELTAERFVAYGGARYYKSGDIAKWTDDGEVVILGRNDGQVKLRGLRIELGEVENTLGACEGVKRSVALIKSINGQEHLCAYYTAGSALAPDKLRQRLSLTLAKYMLPTAYLQLDSLPMTPNGKIDLRALPEAKLLALNDYAPPATEAEEAYCAIFAKALGLERVGAEDNFFDIGGTSLLVTQVTIEASGKGYQISYGDVFDNPTPRELGLLANAAPPDAKEAAFRGGRERSQKTPSAADAVDNYDYDALRKLLQANTIDSLLEGKRREVGNVCITGATGFLGVHLLREYLRSCGGVAYCVVRGGKLAAQTRLKNMLFYYFSDAFDELFGSRIVVLDGDIRGAEVFEKLEKVRVDTLFNCAANVKHFSAGTDIEDVNIGGVRNGLAFSRRTGCGYVQISTTSVAGMSVGGNPPKDVLLDEKKLYFGQDLSNKYVNSKFLAERLVLEAALEGLDAKVIRVGNLMARSEDGEFQANFNTNSFLGRLRAFHILGCIPYGDMAREVEFSPIDCTAAAILKLAVTPKECTVFHAYNDHSVYMGDVVSVLNESGIDVKPCEREEFARAYSKAVQDAKKVKKLSALIAYQNSPGEKEMTVIGADNRYTSQALLRLGFKWPLTSDKYLADFAGSISGLGYFD
ncbi:MAG: amino acid adenylation domain-containing protein [Clostridiales bacterium]|jgi:amino acid adenylation domain-containing protein|nr:amino acid adenylation domain-containing protein [Clostridiales bacterium]